jgi:energy-coupling factor transporter ATP-binding protein EcfA2
MTAAMITGPTASGKSTVAALLAKRLIPSVNIDVDVVKHFVVSGFHYDGSELGIQQWELLGDNLGLLAARYQSHGYNVIVHGYLTVEGWNPLRNHLQFDHKIVLLPNQDVLNRRDGERLAEYQMGPEWTAKHHAHFSTDPFYAAFTVIDSSADSPNDTVDVIEALIGSAGASI